MNYLQTIELADSSEEFMDYVSRHDAIVVRIDGTIEVVTPDDLLKFRYREIMDDLMDGNYFKMHHVDDITLVRRGYMQGRENYNSLACDFLEEVDDTLLDRPWVYGDVLICKKEMM